MAQANLYSLAIIVPAAGLLILGFIARWGVDALAQAWERMLDQFGWAMGVLIAGIVAHELLHGAAWALFGRKPWTAIAFGFQWKTFTPYAHCREPMDIRAYRLGAATPGVVLGLLPAALGILLGHGPIFLFGLLFTVAAAGDALILWLLRTVEPGRLVEDHPTRAGCYVVGRET